MKKTMSNGGGQVADFDDPVSLYFHYAGAPYTFCYIWESTALPAGFLPENALAAKRDGDTTFTVPADAFGNAGCIDLTRCICVMLNASAAYRSRMSPVISTGKDVDRKDDDRMYVVEPHDFPWWTDAPWAILDDPGDHGGAAYFSCGTLGLRCEARKPDGTRVVSLLQSNEGARTLLTIHDVTSVTKAAKQIQVIAVNRGWVRP